MTLRRFLILGFALLNLSALIAEDHHEPPPLPPQAREVSVNDLATFLKEHPGTFTLDVRSAGERNEGGWLAGAKHIDYFATDFDKVLAALGPDPSKPCVVYCEFGGRARRAAQRLAKIGCKEILLPAGGFNAWKKSGKAVEGGSQK